MKRSLGLALNEFYSLAGRLHMDADGQLHVVYDATGVPFVEVVVQGEGETWHMCRYIKK